MQQESPYIQPNVGGLISKLSWHVRKKMYLDFIQLASPSPETSILDVGFTCDQRHDSNFFEKLYPHLSSVTALGTENPPFVKQEFPDLRYVRANGLRLPFKTKSFDLVVCFATLEHVGNQSNQQTFLHELFRVGKRCYFTVPNRWFPVEMHTLLPFVHWLPRQQFQIVCRAFGKDFFAREENLSLISERDIRRMLPPNTKVETAHHTLFGMVSNLAMYITPEETPSNN